MNDENYRAAMKAEIEKRLTSNDWSGRIAKSVIARRMKQQVKLIRGTLATTLGAAALIIVVVLFGVNTDPAPVTYGQFIASQVQGTYLSVFTGIPAESTTLAEHDELLSIGGIDSVINDALMNR